MASKIHFKKKQTIKLLNFSFPLPCWNVQEKGLSQKSILASTFEYCDAEMVKSWVYKLLKLAC